MTQGHLSIDELAARFEAEDAEDAAAPDDMVPADRDITTFDGFSGGSAAATPRAVDGVPYGDLD